MKAAIYKTFQGKISIQDVPIPTPKDHGVIIKVKATGLCLSDWHGWMGHDKDIILPHVPGHELAGIIEAIGKEVKKFRVGDRVTVPFVCGCGTCDQCETGNHQICDNQTQPGFTHWGSFAEYVAIDFADINLVQLPLEIDFETAASLGCRFVTSYRAIVAQGKVKKGEFVTIHGCGGVGLSAIMIANSLGAYVIAVDIDNDTLAFAKELGAYATVNPKEVNVVEKIIQLTHGGSHVSVDALGSQETCFNSIAGLRKRGRHVQIGLMTGNHQHPKIPMDQVMSNELEIIGSHGMQAHKYPEMLSMIQSGKLQPKKLLEKTVTLEEAIEILPKMHKENRKGIWVINRFKK